MLADLKLGDAAGAIAPLPVVVAWSLSMRVTDAAPRPSPA